MKNGIPYKAEYNLLSTDKKIVKVIDGKLKAVGIGTVDIIV